MMQRDPLYRLLILLSGKVLQKHRTILSRHWQGHKDPPHHSWAQLHKLNLWELQSEARYYGFVT
jgi:hypothetical protein